MPTVLFIHSAGPQGSGEGSSQLVGALRLALPADVVLDAPLMPDPDAPQAGLWLPAIAAAIGRQVGPVVLVGHSLGGSSLLQHLAARGAPPDFKGLVLLAVPFWSMANWDVAEFALPADAADRLASIRPVTLLLGNNDEAIPRQHFERYRQLLPAAEARLLPGVDHEAEGAAPAVAEACLSYLRKDQ